MNTLNRLQAIAIVGEKSVSAVENLPCDFTRRVTNDGTTEFSASTWAKDQDGDDVRIIAYYFQDSTDVSVCENLDELNWEIAYYEVV